MEGSGGLGLIGELGKNTGTSWYSINDILALIRFWKLGIWCWMRLIPRDFVVFIGVAVASLNLFNLSLF